MRNNLSRPLIAIGAAVIIGGVLVIYGFFFYSKPVLKAVVVAKITDLTQVVSAPGTVTADEDLSLAFQRGGEMTFIVGDVGTPVTAGEAIASVSSSDLEAQLEGAEAGLTTQKIKLDALMASTTDTTGSDVEVGINNAEMTLLTTLADDYQSLDGTLATNVDELFDNARTNPLFNVSVTEANGTTYTINATANQTSQLDSDRQNVNALMVSWSAADTIVQSSSSENDIVTADKAAELAITAVQTLLSDITTALNPYIGTDATSQGMYNTYKASVNAARSTVAADLATLRSAENNLNSASTPVGPYDVSLEQAAVASAQATVNAIKTQISEGTIISPINGVITEEDVKVGEIASANSPALEVISNGDLQMDAYVSEADISQIQVGQLTAITLDGIGTSTPVFQAAVVSINLLKLS